MFFRRVPLAVTLAALACASCASRLVRLPTDQVGMVDGAPAQAFNEVIDECGRVVSATGRAKISGSVAGRSIHTRIAFAMNMSAATRLEFVEPFGQKKTAFLASAENATLFVPERNAVVRNESALAILEATLGLPLTATDLERLLVCPRGGSGGYGSGQKFGNGWLRVLGHGQDGPYEAYMHRDGSHGVWTLVAMIRRTAATGAAWRADFHDHQHGTWRRVHLMSVDWTGQTGLSYDVELTVEDIHVNPVIDRPALSISVPESAVPITLDEFRATRSGR